MMQCPKCKHHKDDHFKNKGCLKCRSSNKMCLQWSGYKPERWVIALAVNTILGSMFIPKAINKMVIDRHKNCSLHCKYKRMILSGELHE